MAVGGRRVVVLADVPAEELRKAGVPEDVGSALVWTVATSHTAAAPTTDRLPSTQPLPAPAFIGGVAAAVLAYVRVRCCRSDQDALFSLLTLRAGCRGGATTLQQCEHRKIPATAYLVAAGSNGATTRLSSTAVTRLLPVRSPQPTAGSAATM